MISFCIDCPVEGLSWKVGSETSKTLLLTQFVEKADKAK